MSSQGNYGSDSSITRSIDRPVHSKNTTNRPHRPASPSRLGDFVFQSPRKSRN